MLCPGPPRRAKEKTMPSAPLLIIDVQNGFINDATRHIPGRVQALAESYPRVMVTRFSNPEGSNYRRLMGWTRLKPGTDDTALAFTPPGGTTVIDKTIYSCVSPEFLASLAADGIDTVHICGIATDNCVLKCAVDLFEAGLKPVVLTDYCASHGGEEVHQCGLTLLRRLIGEAQVIPGPAHSASR